MLNTINTVDLAQEMSALDLVKLDENIYQISTQSEKPIVIEVIEIDLALKTMRIRHNHSIHDIEFKNNLDLVLDKMGIKRAVDTVSTDIKAPMPGKVIDVIVKEGDEVAKGDPILILEAMKMENVLKAEHDCIIKSINTTQGVSVEKNEILIELA